MRAISIIRDCYDMKKPYQKNMLIGFGISAAFYLLIAFTALLFCSKGVEPDNAMIGNSKPIDIGTIRPPIIFHDPVIQRPPLGARARPNIGIPKPVPDSQAFGAPEIPNQNQLIDINPATSIESLDAGISINPENLGSILPPLDTFIACESQPVPVEMVQPVYPDIARRAGIEGKVWLRVLIDMDGRVREVRVDKSTNPNAGFNEAAVAAAWKTIWKPAIANGIPVSVPVTYAVEFKLDK